MGSLGVLVAVGLALTPAAAGAAGAAAPAAAKGAAAEAAAAPVAPAAAAAKPKVDPKEVALARGEMPSPLPTEEVFALDQRRRRLEARERALADRERQVQALMGQLDARIQRLATLQRQVADYLDRFKKQEEQNLAQLVKVVQSMRPDAAAAALGRMDARLATLVLARMNEKKAAKIMNVLPPEKAVLLASRMGAAAAYTEKR